MLTATGAEARAARAVWSTAVDIAAGYSRERSLASRLSATEKASTSLISGRNVEAAASSLLTPARSSM